MEQPESGTKRDFGNMLNEYHGEKKKKKKKTPGFSPWMKMKPKTQEY